MKRLKVSDFVLGEGEFGVVKRGTYRGLDGRTCNVAVKQLIGITWIKNVFLILGKNFVRKINQLHYFLKNNAILRNETCNWTGRYVLHYFLSSTDFKFFFQIIQW